MRHFRWGVFVNKNDVLISLVLHQKYYLRVSLKCPEQTLLMSKLKTCFR